MWNRNNNGAAEGYSAIPMYNMNDAASGVGLQPGTTPRSTPAVVAAVPSPQGRVSLRQPLLAGADDPVGAQPQHAYYPILPSQAPSAPAPAPQSAAVSGGPSTVQYVMLQPQNPQAAPAQQPVRQLAVSPVAFAGHPPAAPAPQQPALNPNAPQIQNGVRRPGNNVQLRHSNEEVKPHRDWFWCSCLTMVCCAVPAFPCGLLAMLSAVRARSAALYGDSRAALRHSKKAKRFIIGSIVFGMILRAGFFAWQAHEAREMGPGEMGDFNDHGHWWWPTHRHHRHGGLHDGHGGGDDISPGPPEHRNPPHGGDNDGNGRMPHHRHGGPHDGRGGGDDTVPGPPEHRNPPHGGDNNGDNNRRMPTQPPMPPHNGRNGDHGEQRRHSERGQQGGRTDNGEHGEQRRHSEHGQQSGRTDNERRHHGGHGGRHSGNNEQPTPPVDGSDKPEPGQIKPRGFQLESENVKPVLPGWPGRAAPQRRLIDNMPQEIIHFRKRFESVQKAYLRDSDEQKP